MTFHRSLYPDRGPLTAQFPGLEEAEDPVRLVQDAIAQNRLKVAYQPVVDARRPMRAAFSECLARIVDRQGNVLPANLFMPAIESGPAAAAVDRLVLRRAVAVLSAAPVRRLSVNLSRASLGDPAYLRLLGDAVARDPNCGDFLIVEVTENAIAEMNDVAISFLDEIRQMGCSIAIDDFGAGRTSMKQLAAFRFDFLKIDGDFVQDISVNEDNRFLIRTMAQMARHFEMVTVAERVASVEDGAALADMGIDCLQGFSFGEPELAPGWIPASVGLLA